MANTRYVIPEFKGEHYFLSNFYRRAVTFDGTNSTLVFPTAEHAFQAAKFKSMFDADDEYRVDFVNKVLAAQTPTEARRIGKEAAWVDIAHWNSIRVDVMREILLVKFSDADMEALLLDTGDAMLVEGNTWGDTFWGRCDKKGYNILGVLLMEIRGYIRLHNGRWPEITKEK